MAGPRFFPIQGVNLGAFGSPDTFHSQTLLDTQELGMCLEYNGLVYKLVQFTTGTDVVSPVAGGAVYMKTRASLLVSADQGDTDSGLAAEGILPSGAASFVNNDYCFIVIGGTMPKVQVNAATVAGDQMISSATDLTLDRVAQGTASTYQVLGKAVTAYSAGTATVKLFLGILL